MTWTEKSAINHPRGWMVGQEENSVVVRRPPKGETARAYAYKRLGMETGIDSGRYVCPRLSAMSVEAGPGVSGESRRQTLGAGRLVTSLTGLNLFVILGDVGSFFGIFCVMLSGLKGSGVGATDKETADFTERNGVSGGGWSFFALMATLTTCNSCFFLANSRRRTARS